MNQGNYPLKKWPMGEGGDFIDLDLLVAAARRQAWVIGAFVLAGLVLGGAYLLTTPPTYTASTRILLDSSLTKFAEDKPAQPIGPQADAMVSSEVEILKSSRLARTVATNMKLQDNDEFIDPPRSPAGTVKATLKSIAGWLGLGSDASSGEQARIGKAAALLQRSMSAERVGRSFVIELSFSAKDPKLAGTIARAYADAYLSDHLDANFDATERATIWLQGRLAELRDNSQKAALEVEKFRAENGLTAARGELMSEQQLAELNGQLILAQTETANAFARYNQLKSILDSGEENAIANATIPLEKGASGNNTELINQMKGRYLGMAKRERDIVSRFGEDHPQAAALRRELGELNGQIYAELQRLTDSYRSAYEVAKAREDALRASVGDLSGMSSKSGEAQVRLRDLEQKAQALSTLYQSFLARHEEATQQRSFPIAQARVISQASDPTSASSPKTIMVLGLSAVLGLLAGAALGGWREFRERFFRTGDDVRQALDLNFLGYLPLIGAQFMESSGARQRRVDDSGGQAETVTPRSLRVAINAPASAFAETLRNVKLACDVVLQRTPRKVVGFLSALPREGKSTAAANFAGLLAAGGARTLLIDADLRNPGITRALSLTEDKGLVDVLVGDVAWQNSCIVDRKTRLFILPAGARRTLSHTAELISGAAMANLLEQARKSFDYIIVDLPPLGPVVDSKAFAPLADKLVFVAEWGVTPRPLLRSLLQAEPQIIAKTLGVLLNKTDMHRLGQYGQFGSAEQYLDRYASYYIEEPAALAAPKEAA